ncbi:hypothetical protein [Chryseobacterium oryctis]|uniref:Uncharacterized protein n=1 Tax=Chryseobacterium oryctis TaxID=2952618 RepID=A0ABT3HIT2_9FLAO|nr:hypothetical protein [Chryseobacterium oryctis]MCW3159671.1 hypothetical protein [Chryseobacterium oryctis]
MAAPDIKQILFLNKKLHNEYLEVYEEAPLTFEEFVNFMLGTLYDNDNTVEEIIPVDDGNAFIIIYRIPMK